MGRVCCAPTALDTAPPWLMGVPVALLLTTPGDLAAVDPSAAACAAVVVEGAAAVACGWVLLWGELLLTVTRPALLALLISGLRRLAGPCCCCCCTAGDAGEVALGARLAAYLPCRGGSRGPAGLRGAEGSAERHHDGNTTPSQWLPLPMAASAAAKPASPLDISANAASNAKSSSSRAATAKSSSSSAAMPAVAAPPVVAALLLLLLDAGWVTLVCV